MIKHAKLSTIGDGPDTSLIRPSDWNAAHVIDSGTSFPASPNERDLFYRTDQKRLYIYNGVIWVELTPTDLFALTRFLRASRYHVLPLGGTTTLTFTANTLYAIPFFTPVARTITRMAIHVTTLASGAARLGIYSDDGSIYPGSLVLDAGTVDTGTTGVKEITDLNVPFTANILHWLVVVSNATATIAATTAGQHWSLLGFSTAAFNVVGAGQWTVTYSFGTLPATFPTGAGASTAAIPRIAIFF